MSNGPLGGVPGVEYPLVVDRPELPKYCWNCGADTSVIVPSQPLVRMVPDVAGVPRPHYRYICGRCGVIIERNLPGVAESDVWQGAAAEYGDMFQSDYATGQGQMNPNSVDHAMWADAGPETTAVGDMLKKDYASGQGQIATSLVDHAMYADVAGSVPAVKTPYVGLTVANDSINSAVVSGAALQFDTVNNDTNGFAGTVPVDRITIPSGMGGLYLIIAGTSTTGNQGNTIGVSLGMNGALYQAGANQYITGPGSVSYQLLNRPHVILYLNTGDYVQLLSTSVATDAFIKTFLAMVRLGS